MLHSWKKTKRYKEVKFKMQSLYYQQEKERQKSTQMLEKLCKIYGVPFGNNQEKK